MLAAPFPAWNLLFETTEGVSPDQSRPHKSVGPIPEVPHHGWMGTPGPSIAWEHWPRSLTTGLPLVHVLTLWLPEDYQRKGPQLPGVSYFAECGEYCHEQPVRGDRRSHDPFLVDLAGASDHPTLSRRTDILDSEHALIWLTGEELGRGPILPRADPRRPGEHREDSTRNAWDNVTPYSRIWLVPRADPNAGLAPRDLLLEDTDVDGYLNPYETDRSTGKWGLAPWAQQLHLFSHLGGTAFPVNELPEGLTPWYLEVEEIGTVNYGGGNAQIDLESDVFSWSC